ncbi:molybdopterin synthase catalytic subunit MoaE [Glaesserella parasuis]|uniref:Molybdopterin synthase catalytic subunit n=2 Tax=Glaesserella parasuis TaxID=738 RepID=A0A836MBI1_GLAPU|nr:molybdopterin synthase catalytic subunit MoaE [Glaesserella parasuis]AGO15966.1 molybdopterin converting factor, large subunit [Glaesserella parasuis ZJ0906]AIK89498.1 molybdopterin guanine dinucleotide biosynthesis protein MoaE [Glaesserella parasuis]KDB46308.1 molybdopterin guanine dinucleotide biosynthesis protein MoaE [Glaesserella parasuis HPS9]MCT8847406.1 molybdopterin synthase catalytic subunit MoaE [Glaesserella parasuis]MCT8849630.1 molybdopterin synthase catalytic subunit MoaE [G
MEQTLIQVQQDPFDQNAIYKWLSEQHSVGATTLFVGKVREMNLGDSVSGLYLEHYPAMTEKALREIVDEARSRWELQRVAVIHRIGQLYTGDEIVLVGVSSAHRGNAYHANEFIIDYLKTKAPFWKRETTDHGDRWIERRESDQQAADKW